MTVPNVCLPFFGVTSECATEWNARFYHLLILHLRLDHQFVVHFDLPVF